MTCLITGCALYNAAGNMWVWGDLHKIGHNYVFNAVLADNGEAGWQVGGSALMSTNTADAFASEKNAVCFEGGQQFFERRGVITFPAAFGRLNKAASTYLGRLPV